MPPLASRLTVVLERSVSHGEFVVHILGGEGNRVSALSRPAAIASNVFIVQGQTASLRCMSWLVSMFWQGSMPGRQMSRRTSIIDRGPYVTPFCCSERLRNSVAGRPAVDAHCLVRSSTLLDLHSLPGPSGHALTTSSGSLKLFLDGTCYNI